MNKDTYKPRDNDLLICCRSTSISEPGGTCFFAIRLLLLRILSAYRKIEAVRKVNIMRSIDPSVEFRVEYRSECKEIKLFNQPSAIVKIW